MKLNELIKKIESFKKLKPGWSGEKSVVPNNGTIQLAKEIAPRLPAKEDFFVGLCNSGEIIFESNESVIEVYRDK